MSSEIGRVGRPRQRLLVIRFARPAIAEVPSAGLFFTMYRIDLPHLCWSLEHIAAASP